MKKQSLQYWFTTKSCFVSHHVHWYIWYFVCVAVSKQRICGRGGAVGGGEMGAQYCHYNIDMMYKLVIFVLCLLCQYPASIHICKHLFLMIDQTFFSSCLLLFGSVQFFGCLFLYLRVRHPDMTLCGYLPVDQILFSFSQIGSLSSFLYLTRVVSLSLTVWCVWIVYRLMLCGKVIQHWIVSVNDCRCAVSGNKMTCHTADQCLRHGVHDVP